MGRFQIQTWTHKCGFGEGVFGRVSDAVFMLSVISCQVSLRTIYQRLSAQLKLNPATISLSHLCLTQLLADMCAELKP